MSYRNEMKEDFKVICYILAVVCTIASVMVTMFASGIFFVRGCVPMLTATGDKAAEYYVEKIGKDPDVYRLGGKENDKIEEEKTRELGTLEQSPR